MKSCNYSPDCTSTTLSKISLLGVSSAGQEAGRRSLCWSVVLACAMEASEVVFPCHQTISFQVCEYLVGAMRIEVAKSRISAENMALKYRKLLVAWRLIAGASKKNLASLAAVSWLRLALYNNALIFVGLFLLDLSKESSALCFQKLIVLCLFAASSPSQSRISGGLFPLGLWLDEGACAGPLVLACVTTTPEVVLQFCWTCSWPVGIGLWRRGIEGCEQVCPVSSWAGPGRLWP
ncbi:hypothetical protein MP228_008912 [Amoeboaphelidium protococcarum]|nr:hypothetical protein MP228_008912 [Amoeboaphelidium protococcarum]